MATWRDGRKYQGGPPNQPKNFDISLKLGNSEWTAASSVGFLIQSRSTRSRIHQRNPSVV
jgi:hypothetical protein